MLRTLVFSSLTEMRKLVTNICFYNQSYAVGALQKCYRILQLTNESLERVYFQRILCKKYADQVAAQRFWASVLCIVYVATNMDATLYSDGHIKWVLT